MLIIGVGTDIVENRRIAEVLERTGNNFLNRVFTKGEIAYCTGKKGIKIDSLAVRFAAKEAVAKAIGTGLGKVNWKDIEIIAGENGEPLVKLTGKAAEKARERGGNEFKISLSHTKDYSVAFAILNYRK